MDGHIELICVPQPVIAAWSHTADIDASLRQGLRSFPRAGRRGLLTPGCGCWS